MTEIVSIDVPHAGPLKVHTHDDGDPYISGYLRLGNIFEPHILTLLTGFLKPGDRFLDVGANLGWFALIGSRLVGRSGRVYALEPDPDNYRLLQANLQANACRNVRTWQCAAGTASRRAALSRSSVNRGDHRVSASPIQDRNSVDVDIRSVDNLLWLDRRMNVVLVDTQGSEVNVFRGMRKTLRRNPCLRIVFEYWPHGLESCGSSAGELAAVAREHGWRLWLIDSVQPPQPIVAEDLARLARQDFTPASERHADVVALSPADQQAIAFMETLAAPPVR
jgi:FkbM family methyltransferase